MKIEINTPKWVDTFVATTKYAYNSIKWIVKPPRCECCGKRMPTRSFHVEHHEDGQERLLVENMKLNLVCPECILKEVESGVVTNNRTFGRESYKRKGVCDCCGTRTSVWKFFETDKIRLHFCIRWWNGFYVCRKCITDTLKKGNLCTSVFRTDGFGKHWMLGMYGLFIENGKVKLFRKTKY